MGRAQFLGERIELHPARVIERSSGVEHGQVPAVELVTIGQRRGLSTDSSARARYVVDVDVERRVVTVGDKEDLMVDALRLVKRTWVHGELPIGVHVLVQSSAHGIAREATIESEGVRFSQPSRQIAPGQIVALYLADVVVGSGVVAP
jgi:tRNA-specific 2-thiouridylase